MKENNQFEPIRDDDIMVSVNCLVYNHEKYLRRCLDGFVMQKTNFAFEVLIHDDASTDGSADIIREYEAKYPDIIKPIYQTENKYSKGEKISWKYQIPRVRGEYIAFCEGDDYWTDEHKLQKQVDLMEENPNCSFCGHFVRHVNEDGTKTEGLSPALHDIPRVMTQDQWIEKMSSEICATPLCQTSSYLFRSTAIRPYWDNIPKYILEAPIGDVPLQWLAMKGGGMCFVAEEMSCYRLNANGSWSSRMNASNTYRLHYERMIQMCDEYAIFAGSKFASVANRERLRCEIKLMLEKQEYRELLKPHYRSALKRLSKRERLHIYAAAYFPGLLSLCKKILRRNNGR